MCDATRGLLRVGLERDLQTVAVRRRDSFELGSNPCARGSDSARRARRVGEGVARAERSLRNGLTRDAQQQEQPAGRGIQKLREGIEEAAEAVLGDETEALRRAREELQRLSSELNDEVNRNSPTRSAQPGQNQSGQPQPADGQQQGRASRLGLGPRRRGEKTECATWASRPAAGIALRANGVVGQQGGQQAARPREGWAGN